jgi:hypothetical protein
VGSSVAFTIAAFLLTVVIPAVVTMTWPQLQLDPRTVWTIIISSVVIGVGCLVVGNIMRKRTPEHVVTSHNQSGGITAHTVNQVPPPEFKQHETTVSKNADGSFTSTTEFEVIAPVPPVRLSLQAEAASIVSMDLAPEQGMEATRFQGGAGWKRKGVCSTRVMRPDGRYLLHVRTGKREPIKVVYQFD